MTPLEWTVIGAGPAGVAAIGKLLDAGIPGEAIAWIDPDFAVGDFGGKWRAVPGNTEVALFIEYLTASPSFRFDEAPADELLDVDPHATCALGVVADVLAWITSHLCKRVHVHRTVATELQLNQRHWSVKTHHGLLVSKNVVLAIGSVPSKLSHPGLKELPLEVVFDPEALAALSLDDARVAVFGSSHSTMIALPNLLASPGVHVVNFYRTPLKYALALDDWTLFEDTGLKGKAAQWARANIDGTWPARLDRCAVDAPEFADKLAGCDHVVYTVGFHRRQLPCTPQWGMLDYDATTGILAPGLFGLGVAFPGSAINPLGALEYRVGLVKFMRRLNDVLPLWLQYGP